MISETNWHVAAEQELGVQFGALVQLGGGDFAQSYRATVSSVDAAAELMVGDLIFIKTHSSPLKKV